MSTETVTKTNQSTKLQPPKKWNVIIHNDNKTTFDFVIYVLRNIFNHSQESAEAVTMAVHEKNKGVAGRYSHEIAHAKMKKTVDLARANGFPLSVTCEVDN